ncbi:CHASE domain-containing protein [Marinobacter sp.]|uniref:CHASE domain-containing protein n=1 Tax=Marinobacter sp. TaxID=50741 RepID=UPI003562D21B
MPKLRGAAAQITKLHWVVICLSLLLTITVWQIFAQIAEARARDQFDHRVKQLNELLTDRMQKYEFALISGVGTIRANGGKVTLAQWQRFAEALAVQDRLPGISGIGVIRRISEAELGPYLLEERKSRPDFRVHPPHKGTDYWPITYLEPLAGNEAAIGLDMAHESNRYTAALKAMRTGETQITGPIALVQDDEKKPGFLFYHPFYNSSDESLSTPNETDFAGLVYAPFIVASLMEGTLKNTNRLVHFRIRDGDQELYSEFSETAEDNYDTSPMFQTSYPLEIYGREWQFDVQTTQLFEKYNVSKQPVAILISGLIINGLILTAFLLLSNGKQRAEQEVIKKTAELKLRTQEAESAVRVKTAFLANMSHEIRTPMNAIIGILVLLKESRLNDYSQRLANKAFSASEILLQLLNDILDLSRIEADHIKINNQSFEIEELVQRSVELFAIAAEEKGLSLRVNIDPSTPRCVTGDLMRISQICCNLVGNAIKFTHEGQVTVDIRFNKTDDTRGTLEISVEDTGIGIREEDQKRVFENFRQADESTSRVYGGSGLGLAISSHLAQLMGASLTLKSRVNEGSRFTLMVPVGLDENEKAMGVSDSDQSAPDQPDKDTPLPRPSFQNLKALIVDDMPLNCEIVESYLESFGVASESVHSGAQAMQQLLAQKFDLILMDLHLDGETGQEITQQIRSRKNLHQPIIAALSASISEHDRNSSFAAGMDDFLTKPVLPRDIQRLLQSFFKQDVTALSAPPSDSKSEQTDAYRLPDFISRPLHQKMFGMDPDLFHRCVRSFLASSIQMQTDIENSLHLNDPKITHAVTHKIKGAASNIANLELVQLCEQIDKALDAGESEPSPDMLLTTLIEHTRQLSEMTFSEESLEPTGQIRSEPVNHIIARMTQRLSANRIAPDSDIDQVLEYLRKTNKGTLASQLRQALDTYNFSEALELLGMIDRENKNR